MSSPPYYLICSFVYVFFTFQWFYTIDVFLFLFFSLFCFESKWMARLSFQKIYDIDYDNHRKSHSLRIVLLFLSLWKAALNALCVASIGVSYTILFYFFSFICAFIGTVRGKISTNIISNIILNTNKHTYIYIYIIEGTKERENNISPKWTTQLETP